MRVRELSVVFFFLLTVATSHAQTNFLKGYYLTHQGDTTHGFIEYRFDKRNYHLCVFKSDLNSKPVELQPDEISGYTVNGQDFFITRSFKNKKGEQLNGFFRIVVKGKLSLLRYQSKYYAQTPTGEVYEISKGSVTKGNQVRDDNYGLGMLNILMKDCTSITETAISAAFNRSQFTDLFITYNQCSNSLTGKSSRVKVKPHADLGLVVSATQTTLDATSFGHQLDFEPNTSFSAGGYVSVFVPKVDEKLRFVLEATYITNSYYTYYSTAINNNDFFVDYSAIRVPVLLRYNFGKIFVDAGMQNQFIIDQDQQWRIEAVEQDDRVYTTDGTTTPLKSWSNGWLIGAGVNLPIGNHLVKPSLRYSFINDPREANEPLFQTFELSLAFEF